jgi:hypothetical protein
MPVPVYNPRKQMMACKRVLSLALVMVWIATACSLTHAAANREQPVATLAQRIAAIAGPGPAMLTIRNRSAIGADELPAIRMLLERDLRGYGITVSGADSATAIRVTLSENAAGGLWVAEVHEGPAVRVVMVPVDLETATATPPGVGLSLRRELIWRQREPVLDLLMLQGATTRRMVVLEPERITSYGMTAGAWTKDQEFAITHTTPFPRDMRGRLVVGHGHLFDAYLPGVLCTATDSEGKITAACADSDDPWPLPVDAVQNGSTDSGQDEVKAFYNSTRNYFTGAVAQAGKDLQPFYSAAVMGRANGAGMLLNGLDGRAVMLENGVLKPIAGARDWGSDLVAIRSTCGLGFQVLVSASGAAPVDSVRAYQIPGREAEAVSQPIEFEGPVMAMWPSADGASATVVVRKAAAGRDQPELYEVYGVSALCN